MAFADLLDISSIDSFSNMHNALSARLSINESANCN